MSLPSECVLLAAGEGKRMRPLTANRPKVMIPIANRPMLEHLITAASRLVSGALSLLLGMKNRQSGNISVMAAGLVSR